MSCGLVQGSACILLLRRSWLLLMRAESCCVAAVCLSVNTHSQDFLNGVCTHIIWLTQRKLTYYTGNYDTFKKTVAENEVRDCHRAARGRVFFAAVTWQQSRGSSFVAAVLWQQSLCPITLITDMPGSTSDLGAQTACRACYEQLAARLAGEAS